MSFANGYNYEATLNTTSDTINFPVYVRELQITNDASSGNLQYKFNSSETYRTLKPGETSRVENIRTNKLLINATGNVPYRIWGLG